MGEPSGILSEDAYVGRTAQERAERVHNDLSPSYLFNAYDDVTWEKTSFYPETGGFLVTEKRRIAEAKKSKNNQEIFSDEQEVCKHFASKGFQIEHIAEPRGKKAPDARIISGGKGLIKINGLRAEIKSTASTGNVVRYGTKGIHEKHADIMIYRFKERNPDLVERLHELARKGIHGYYYYDGDNDYREF